MKGPSRPTPAPLEEWIPPPIPEDQLPLCLRIVNEENKLKEENVLNDNNNLNLKEKVVITGNNILEENNIENNILEEMKVQGVASGSDGDSQKVW